MPNKPEGVSDLEVLLEKAKKDIADAIRLDHRNVSLEMLIDEVLRRKLLPLLEAGKALAGDVGCNSTKRQQLVGAHDAAKLAALKGDS